jgi:hypothetical protein
MVGNTSECVSKKDQVGLFLTVTVPFYRSHFGGDDGIRTHDLYVANVPLSQLSYIPTDYANLYEYSLFFNTYFHSLEAIIQSPSGWPSAARIP